jgi:hypothetical protein
MKQEISSSSKGRTRTGPSAITKTRLKKSPQDSKRYEMLDHDILTAKEEQTLGKKLRRAIEVKKLMAQLLERKHQPQLERGLNEDGLLQEMTADVLLGGGDRSHFDDDEDLEGLSIYGMDQNAMFEMDKTSLSAGSIYSRIDSRDLEQWDMDDSETDSSYSSPFVNSDHSTKHSDLTEEDIIEKLGIPGGRDELTRILIYGALARDKMIKPSKKAYLDWQRLRTALSRNGISSLGPMPRIGSQVLSANVSSERLPDVFACHRTIMSANNSIKRL